MAEELDRELSDLGTAERWAVWMRRIEAVLFASATPVPREALARVVGRNVSVELLLADLEAELRGRAVELAPVAGGWILRTRPAYAAAIRAAADVDGRGLDLRDGDLAILAAIAWHQPITRDRLNETLGREVGRETLGRLRMSGLIGTGPRSPRRGAPHTFVTTEAFLLAFGLQSLRDLPGPEDLADP